MPEQRAVKFAEWKRSYDACFRAIDMYRIHDDRDMDREISACTDAADLALTGGGK
jgi:hypothetical protein